jgi:large subunit ribosomal protein L18
LAVYRSNKAIYAQLIDDEKGVTIAAADSRTADGASVRERARAVGTTIAAAAQKAEVTRAVFDRGGFLFTGAIKEVAEGAREGGLAL